MITVENKALVLDLAEWIAARPRPYAEVMNAWRTSCRHLTVWKGAVDLRAMTRVWRDGECESVDVTPWGWAFLREERYGQPGGRVNPPPRVRARLMPARTPVVSYFIR